MLPPKDSALGTLKIVEVYEYLDGPRLFSSRNERGEVFIAVWVDSHEGSDTWLYVPISSEQFLALGSGDLELRAPFVEGDGNAFRVVSDLTGKLEVTELKKADVPEEWLPESGERLKATEALKPELPNEKNSRQSLLSEMENRVSSRPPQLRMLEAFECLGRWWTDANEPVPGRLTFSPTDGVKLDLIGTLDPLRAGRVSAGSHAVMWGRSVQGYNLTLFGSLEATSQLNLPGEKISTYNSSWMVVGEHLLTSDAATFNELDIGIFNLEEWLGFTGITYDNSARPGQGTIRYKQQPPLKFLLGPFEVSAELEGRTQLNSIPPSASITERARIRIACADALQVGKFLEGPVRSLQYLLELAIGARVPLTSLLGVSRRLLHEPPNADARPAPVSILFVQKRALPAPDRKHAGHMLFTASALGARLHSVVEKWYRGADIYRDALDFHFSVDPQDPGIPLEFKFFSAFVACEAYHRATHHSEQLAPAEYKRRRELLLSAVKSDADLTQWANEKILGNDPSARRRIEDLFDEQPKSVRALVDSKESFLKRVIATRNRRIAHGYGGGADILSGRELYRATLLLRLMLQTCLLRDVGFTAAELETTVSRITEYRIVGMS